MTRVDNKYVISKMEAGESVTLVNFNTLKIRDCGTMTMDELLVCIKDAEMCVFFVKNEKVEE